MDCHFFRSAKLCPLERSRDLRSSRWGSNISCDSTSISRPGSLSSILVQPEAKAVYKDTVHYSSAIRFRHWSVANSSPTDPKPLCLQMAREMSSWSSLPDSHSARIICNRSQSSNSLYSSQHHLSAVNNNKTSGSFSVLHARTKFRMPQKGWGLGCYHASESTPFRKAALLWELSKATVCLLPQALDVELMPLQLWN